MKPYIAKSTLLRRKKRARRDTIVAAVRTPVGNNKGKLAEVLADDMAAMY